MSDQEVTDTIGSHIHTLEEKANVGFALTQASSFEQSKTTLPDWLLSLLDPDDYEKSHARLQKLVESLPVFRLILATAPVHSAIETWVKAFRQKWSVPLVLEIVIEPDILGGIICEYDGKRTDVSVRGML